jgi:hypothetical protein
MDDAAMNELINPNGLTQYVEGLISENGAHTYTLTLSLPAGATVRDATVTPEAAWTAATSAALNAGEAGGDTDNYFINVDMKTQSTEMSLFLASTGSGDVKGTEPRYASAQDITFVIVSVGAGTAGRTRCRIYYSVPSSVLAPVIT